MISLVVCQVSHYYDVTSAKETKQESIFRLKLLQQFIAVNFCSAAILLSALNEMVNK